MEPRTRLGPYEILEPLGAGGMGEVYLAQDTRLGRKVAVKVLPEEFASDPERLARFKQEARAAAALNHPHIAVVHDVGTEAATHFIVQEYLEGQSLRQRLEAGPLPLDDALGLAAEVGEALVAAHGAGIIHRDLKPDNIFVTDQGHAKVLDFGLAKLTEMTSPAGGGLSMSPTMLGTVAGQVMGTAGYMAPEQAEGDATIDQRADLFAFGCVLYEMVAGAQPFAGRSVADTLARIQHEEPTSLAERAPSVPAELERIIGKCLAKQRPRRYQHADDLIVDMRALQAAIATGGAVPSVGAAAALPPPTRSSPLRLAAAALLGAAATVIVMWTARTSQPAEVTRLSLELNDGLELSTWSMNQGRPALPSFVLSPDGRSIVYSATDGRVRQLYLRALDRQVATAMDGTEDADFPFFSPDGEWVGFFNRSGLNRVRAAGGAVERVFEPDDPFAALGFAAWTREGTIVFSFGTVLADIGVVEVPASGGTPRALTTPDPSLGRGGHLFPQMLPGGRGLLFNLMNPTEVPSLNSIVVENLDTSERSVVIEGGSDPRYLDSGHLVFMRDGKLVAAAFDVDTLAATSEPIVVIDDVMHAERGSHSLSRLGIGQFSVSSTGTLAYAIGGIFPEWHRSLEFVDREGARERLAVPDAYVVYPRISPDGARVA